MKSKWNKKQAVGFVLGMVMVVGSFAAKAEMRQLGENDVIKLIERLRSPMTPDGKAVVLNADTDRIGFVFDKTIELTKESIIDDIAKSKDFEYADDTGEIVTKCHLERKTQYSSVTVKSDQHILADEAKRIGHGGGGNTGETQAKNFRWKELEIDTETILDSQAGISATTKSIYKLKNEQEKTVNLICETLESNDANSAGGNYFGGRKVIRAELSALKSMGINFHFNEKEGFDNEDIFLPKIENRTQVKGKSSGRPAYDWRLGQQ